MATDRKVKPSNLDIQIWADTGNKQFPTQPKYDAGWNFEVPIDEEENYIQNQQDAAIANANQQGVMDWDSSTTYFKNSWVTYDDGVNIYKYVSLTDSNEGNTPVDPVSANWSRIDYSSSLAQTMADSNLNNVSIDGGTLVAAVDLNNVTDLGGNDPALETLASKIGNDSGFVKVDQLLKTNSNGNVTVNEYLGANSLLNGYSGFNSSPVITTSLTGKVYGNSTSGLILQGAGTSRDVSLYNKDAERVVSVLTTSTDLTYEGRAQFNNSNDVGGPVNLVKGQVLATNASGLILQGSGSTFDVTLKNKSSDTVVGVLTDTVKLQHSGKSTYLNSSDQASLTGSETGSIYGATGGGLNLQGSGSTNDFTLRNKNNTTVAIIPTGNSYLYANSSVSTNDNSNKYATTSMVQSLTGVVAPTFDQFYYDTLTAVDVGTSFDIDVDSFTAGATGKALIEFSLTFYFNVSTNHLTQMITTLSGGTGGNSVQEIQMQSNGNGTMLTTVLLQHDVTSTSFANVSNAKMNLNRQNQDTPALLYGWTYKVTPY